MKLILGTTRPTQEFTIYEAGKRTTDPKGLQKAFDEQVEEDEADGWSVEVLLNQGKGIKDVPVTKGTYPTEYNFDKKIFSSVGPAFKFKPTALAVAAVAKEQDETIRQQLTAMLFCDSAWLEEILGE